MKTIVLREALAIVDDSTRPFDIEFVSFDRNRKKQGSQFISLKNCVKSGANHNRKANGTIVVSRTDRKDHPYPVHIHLITKINDHLVIV